MSEFPEDHPLDRSSTPQVLSDPVKSERLDTRTFKCTISVVGDISEQCVTAMKKYMKTACAFAYGVVEHGKTGKAHLHALLVYDTAMHGKKLQENINKRYVKQQGHPEAKNGLATVVTVQYDHDWYDEYLKKETGVQVIYDKYDRDVVSGFFPTKEVQAALQERANPKYDPYKRLDECVAAWTEATPECESRGINECHEFIFRRMFSSRLMEPIFDRRKLRDFVLLVWRMRNRYYAVDGEDEAYYRKVVGV